MQVYAKNKYQLRNPDNLIKIPIEAVPFVVQDIPTLRKHSIYLKLKPLFYCGRIQNYARHYSELAEYCELGTSTFRKYLKDMISDGLIRKDKKDLQLCSWHDYRKMTGCTTKKTVTLKQNQRCIDELRTLAIWENLGRQEYVYTRRAFANDLIQERSVDQINLHSIGKNTPIDQNITVQRFVDNDLPDLLKKRPYKDSFNAYKQSEWEKVKYYKRYLKLARAGIDVYDRINPIFTLSCKGLARTFGLSTPGAGHYWSVKLEQLGLIDVQKRWLFCDGNSISNAFWQEQETGRQMGLFQAKGKKGERLNIRMLTNKLIPKINMNQAPEFT